MKVRQVRVFSTTNTPPIDVADVVATQVADGVYTVKQASGMIYRFPTALILYASETPARPQK